MMGLTASLPHTGQPLTGTHAQRLALLTAEAQATVDDPQSEEQAENAHAALLILDTAEVLVGRDNYKRELAAKLRKASDLLGISEARR